ncbi:hypothetical protein TURU_091637 [Turdus rufiventris]|nr:hypothetical protein TURU_091637 [Turdus rufiventris]
MKVHVEPWRTPVLEQVDAQKKLWPSGKSTMEQDPGRTCAHMKQGVQAGAGTWQDLWSCEGRSPCWSRILAGAVTSLDRRSSVFLEDCILWKGPLLHQFMKELCRHSWQTPMGSTPLW